MTLIKKICIISFVLLNSFKLKADPFYYTKGLNPRPKTTTSKVPHLPVYSGHVSTNNTYRFINVVEQVLTMIGEGKHGLWRIQDNGMVREYRKKKSKGIRKDTDIFDKKNLKNISEDYGHYLKKEGLNGYKLPQNKIDKDNYLKYIDLPINHPKYKGKYLNHVPIDLPIWYCTMSQADYPHAKKVFDFAFSQPSANRVGPLGKRAGLDIKENYTNILRLNLFKDARSWVNIGTSNKVDWQAIDTKNTKAEFYIAERPFFNQKRVFMVAVFANKSNEDFSYIRPDGPYYKHLLKRGFNKLKIEPTQNPRFYFNRKGIKGSQVTQSTGTLLRGVHHLYKASFTGGGSCPMRGGDWADYPKTTGGSGWPTNYEEITPLCDAVLVDIKLTTNLDGVDWDSPSKYLANSGHGKINLNYNINPKGFYGKFIDPYNIKNGIKNKEATNIGPVESIIYKALEKPVKYNPN